jgi:AP-3 complex subunit mu
MISPPSIGQKLIDSVTGQFAVKSVVHHGDSRIPWRSTNVSHLQNEIYFDLVEQIDCIVAANELLIACEVLGDIRCKSSLSGMPDLTLTFNKASLIDDASLHRCIRINRWKMERVLSFVPPDGKFKLMSYRVRGVTQLPIYVKPRLDFMPGSCKVQILVGPKFAQNKVVENLILHIPFPACVLSSSLSCNVGEIKTDPISKVRFFYHRHVSWTFFGRADVPLFYVCGLR